MSDAGHESLGASFERRLDRALRGRRFGRLVEVTGAQVKVAGVDLRVGQLCELSHFGCDERVLGEVVGLTRETALVTLLGDVAGLGTSTLVRPCVDSHRVCVGTGLLGRVLDGLGRPLDGGPALDGMAARPSAAAPPPPLTRPLIRAILQTGIRAIDGFLTMGRGQRIGIFAPAGAGKSTLLGMMARNMASGAVCVVALIGERGREVREFLDEILSVTQRQSTVVVAATSDRPSMERIKAAYTATTIAEYFRDEGYDVLLLCDSVTRFARAMRETGLAAGEPAVRRGYPPSVFAALPGLVERAGPAKNGNITALYTVLLEDAEITDPIGEEIRSLLDGHIVLSPKLASAGHYPAIDIRSSISRVMPQLVDFTTARAAARCREWITRYDDAELLLQIGEYRDGGDPVLDSAIAAHGDLADFLKQGTRESVPIEETTMRLRDIAQQYAGAGD
ncbi:putative ATP synthase YscN [Burkholderia thailandensis MSMB121]|uniref:FliI/YscN family ATPase n=1 Tax=Burkholderia humptydooensis TaxID=430531 RepID=UPI000327FB76|nr:FliI/YscN family ATPase [Burkholderia humptydooensis]AGK51059.1 putative ATP synthase YscN [Burkholderia thailandensis MSMB121]ATF32286.1 FliI/YscN family ATPase [Burkholderia thailandensis]KST72351.1 type III secretion apparatus H+-transporting two-sector ATPase [Burkholderia humptydooensis]